MPSKLVDCLKVLSIGLVLTVLQGCGGSNSDQPIPANKAPPITAPTSTVSSPTPANDVTKSESSSVNSAETTATARPPQVSETADDSETVEEPTTAPASQPALKLAAAAAAEGKAPASQFKEGVHYQRLVPTQPTSASPGQVEIVEVFWYGCPHCFALDSKLEAWRKKGKANYVAFLRLPATWNDATLFHGRIFYAAEELGKLEELHTPIFREIHLNGNLLDSADKAKALFAAHGVAKADFDKAFNSFSVNTKLQTAGLLNRRYHVQSVPFFVINGKYTCDVGTAGGEEQLIQLINELAAREHR